MLIDNNENKALYCLYLLYSCSSKRTYTGIALDPWRRLRQHNGDIAGGCRTTTRGRPWRIIAIVDTIKGRSMAQRLEYEVKRKGGMGKDKSILKRRVLGLQAVLEKHEWRNLHMSLQVQAARIPGFV